MVADPHQAIPRHLGIESAVPSQNAKNSLSAMVGGLDGWSFYHSKISECDRGRKTVGTQSNNTALAVSRSRASTDQRMQYKKRKR